MLRVEAYPMVGGMMVRVVGVDHSKISTGEGDHGKSGCRLIPTPYIEQVGVDLAVQYAVRGILEAYPEIVEYALL